jgi:hypothetical protein
VLIGGAGAFVLTRFLRTLLYEVTPTDPLHLCRYDSSARRGCAYCIRQPARRIMKLNPMIVLLAGIALFASGMPRVFKGGAQQW